MSAHKKTTHSPEVALKSGIEAIDQEFASPMGWFGLQLKPAELNGLVRAYAADAPLAIEAITKIIAHRLRLDFIAKEREEADVVDKIF